MVSDGLSETIATTALHDKSKSSILHARNLACSRISAITATLILMNAFPHWGPLELYYWGAVQPVTRCTRMLHVRIAARHVQLILIHNGSIVWMNEEYYSTACELYTNEIQHIWLRPSEWQLLLRCWHTAFNSDRRSGDWTRQGFEPHPTLSAFPTW